MPPFSRLQLAAALIEYDNDPDDPDGPYRCAEESAIFLFLKGRPQPRNTIMGYDEMPRRSVDFLGVAIPGETEGTTILENQQNPSNLEINRQRSIENLTGGRKTPDGRRSVELLVRPSSELARLNGSMFRGGDGEDSEEEDEELAAAGPTLNLASWGIDEFLVKEQPRARLRASSINALNGARSRASSINALNAADTVGEGPRPRVDSKASSNVLHDATIPEGNRRSMGNRSQSMGDWGGRPSSELEPWEAARTSMYSSRPRPSSMADPTEIAARQQQPPVTFRSRSRAGSVMSLSGQQAIAFPSTEDQNEEATPNPFELPLSAENASRFDPKTITHQRSISFASLSTHHVLGGRGNGEFSDNASVMTGAIPPPGTSRFSRIDLLRPKVLIMPPLLQDAPEEAPLPPKPVRDGFMESTDARPLPPGAKTARTSAYGNGFGVNPRSSMTLSQLTFRNSLMVGGQRDPSYADLEENLRRAEKEGEIIQQEVHLEPEVEETVPHRAPGKLYGRSLIDDLEARKAQLKSKQRVFRGDERPSMMQRVQPTRSSTLIDAEALQRNAQGAILRPELHRNPSSKEPLLNFAGDPIPGTTVQARPQMGRAGSSMPNSRSVFGVDQIWEKELAKLQQIEALERAEEEERKRVEAEQHAREEAKAAKKAAKKAKGKNKPVLDTGPGRDQYMDPDGGLSPIARAPEAPPILPTVDPFAMPPKPLESSDSDSDADPTPFNRAQSRMQNSKSQQDWLSDDERQAAAARPRPRPRPTASTPARNMSSFAAGLHINKSESEDSDVPLTNALARAKQRQQAEDSEEDKPLAAIFSNSLSTLDFGGTLLADVKKPAEPKLSMPQPRPALRNAGRDDEDEDDQPLGIRASRFGLGGGDDDDEKPLGMRYSMAPSQMFVQQQQQQQQQQVMMQQQMMQQQMMVAAQMRGSMFNPMMMGNANMGIGMGYGNSMSMSGMGPGMMAMQGPQMGMMDAGQADPAKLSAVDRWRRGVGGAEG